MLLALLIVNIVVWAGVFAYTFRLFPSPQRYWRGGVAVAAVVAALVLSAGSYHLAQRARAKETALKHYYAGIDERRRGNLEEAEKHFERAESIQPGTEDARRQLEEMRQQKPAEQRVQEKETRVQPSPTPATASSGGPPPSAGKPGEKPKPAAHLPSPFEIAHYALDVAIDPAAHTLDATATIRVRSRGERVPKLDFSLLPECKPSDIRFDGAPAKFTHVNDLLSVTPARPLEPGKDATVTVKYRREGGALVKNGEGLISADGTYFLSESRWYPATGELDFRSPVRVKATVPRGYTVVSVGALKGIDKSDPEKATFHWETDRFASMVSLAAAKYVQQSVSVPPVAGPGARPGPLKITCYNLPGHRDRAAAFLKEAAAITRYFERSFGAYPYEKLAVVEIPLFPGGYGTTSFVMLIDQSFEEKKVPREFLAHEIAHQWWGNSMFPQGLGAAWLTEAFANYSAWMYEASITGNPRVLQRRVSRAVADYFQEVARKGDQPLYETDPYQPLGATHEILYEKGAVVLHMLRRQMGDRLFMRTLRAFADEYRFGKAKIEDFRRIAERESGQDLGWFFDQWLGRTGGMALAYSFDTEADTPTQNKAVLMVTQAKPAYRAKLQVLLDVENTVRKHEIELTGEEHQTFEFPVKGKVTNVLLDPQGWYLMRPPKWVVAQAK